ncbi:MAG: hypothetical protein K6T65_12785 [Peptococcaceae bacterium]|nr:hypothetical protein [Peptococcaceae bacterium]
MSSGDFFSTFELYKERYLQQDQALENKRALDHFERWLKGNKSLLQVKPREVKNKKIDLGKFLTQIVSEAKKILADKGIQINCVSLGLKESSKCISVFSDNTVYYRLGRTCPRIGPYGGMELLVMELIMDGNKNNIFVPLLKQQHKLEKLLGNKVERENPRVEATGKYRFKLLFPFEYNESAGNIGNLGGILANFIYFTRDELIKLNVS